jgi:hypothetical protein
MGNNIALNKPATASSTVIPFTAARAVDGITTDSRNRWVCCQTPAWLTIDLQNNFWVNQWFMNFMSSVGWAARYTMSDFKLQGSLDNISWFDMDAIVNNTTSSLNRTIAPKIARFLKISITKGLLDNSQVSSIVDLQAFEPANAPFLSALTPSTGALVPGFTSRTFAYFMTVDSSMGSIAFTPTAAQAGMVIKVNGAVVQSGQQSAMITLNPGANAIPIEVVSSDNAMKTTYTATVTRASAASYLSNLTVKNNHAQPVALTPSFAKTTLSYSASVASGVASVTVTPVAENASATILVNNVPVTSGQQSSPITLNTGVNVITILVASVTTYTISITKS